METHHRQFDRNGNPTDATPTYSFTDGRLIRKTTFTALRDQLEPVADGLFEFTSQTWRLKDAP